MTVKSGRRWKKFFTMHETDLDHRLLLLCEDDNVVVARTRLGRGTDVLIDGSRYLIDRDVLPGFKIARTEISPGQKILRYGAPIGSATQEITPGARIHTDNMKSDYIAIHTNESDESHVA